MRLGAAGYAAGTAPKDIMQFGANFFVSSTGSRLLGEMKTSINDKKLVAIKAPFNISEMVNHHFNLTSSAAA